MVDRKVIQEWLGKADEDFNFACRNVEDEENTFYAQICFHFQQAAEKYLKTYIVAHELTFKKIHELPELLKICREDSDLFSKLEKECNFLTDFYIDTRYPVHWPIEISRENAQKALDTSYQIGRFVKELLEQRLNIIQEVI